uniref:Uncharacterized protein n=1 Tax=viral metagenome TaxID=1070528 RepID=A0A6M3KFH7_9ZZZZ
MPLTIQQFKQEYPEYRNVPDNVLVNTLHRKFYSEVPYNEFTAKIGYVAETMAPEDINIRQDPDRYKTGTNLLTQKPTITDTVSGEIKEIGLPDEQPIQQMSVFGQRIPIDPSMMTEAGPIPDISLEKRFPMPPDTPTRRPQPLGAEDLLKERIRKSATDADRLNAARELSVLRAKMREGVKSVSPEDVRPELVGEGEYISTGRPIPHEKITAYAPYLTIAALKGVLDPILPALKATGMNTDEVLDTAIEYWKKMAGDVTFPDVGFGRDKKGDLVFQKRQGSIKNIAGETAGLGGFVLGPLKTAGTAAGAVVQKFGQGARPFFQHILRGMITGALVGKGEKEETLHNMALFGVIEPMAYGIGKTTDLIKEMRKTKAWIKSGPKERGLMIQSLEETLAKNPNITEGEILKRWNNPLWRKQALERRIKPPEEPPTAAEGGAPVVSPEPPPSKPPAPEAAAAPIETGETIAKDLGVRYLGAKPPGSSIETTTINPETLKGIKIETQIRIAENNEIVRAEIDASEAYLNAQSRKELYQKILDCIR